MNGFKRFDGLTNIQYIIPEMVVTKENDVESPADRVFNLIFARDKHGWPNSSVEVMLSPKTSEEVRNFIQQNLLIQKDEQHLFNQPEVANEFQKLSSDFIAKTSRNRYESIEDYETRLRGIMDDYEKEQTFKSFHEKLRNLEKSK
jgi:hypothetical protein